MNGSGSVFPSERSFLNNCNNQKEEEKEDEYEISIEEDPKELKNIFGRSETVIDN